MFRNDIVDEIYDQIKKEGINIDPDIDYEILAGSTFEFKDGNKIYHLEYTVSLTDNQKRIFDFKFKLMNNPKMPKRINFKTDQQFQIALKKSQIGITGTGNAKKIFDKVISVIVKIVYEKKPEYINFQADEENRQKLYKFLIKDVIKKIDGYKLINVNPLNNDKVVDGDFWLEKI